MSQLSSERETPGSGGFLKWVVTTAVAAVITGGIGTYFSHFADKSKTEGQRLIEEEKLRADHRDFVVKRIQQHDEDDRKLSEDLKGQYYSVKFENPCDTKMFAAIRYTALDGETNVVGWYTFKPKEKGKVLSTKQTWFDFYAKTSAGEGLTDKDSGDYRLVVETHDKFEYLDDHYFQEGWLPLGHPTTVFFKRISLEPDSSRQFVYALPCTAAQFRARNLLNALSKPKVP
jgi:hypothetical protein